VSVGSVDHRELSVSLYSEWPGESPQEEELEGLCET
jgi:hypothetical protein